MIRFSCLQCGKSYCVGEDLAGRRGWCAACKVPITVPTLSDSEPRSLTLEEQVETLRGLLSAAEERYRRHEERFRQADRLARALYQRYKALREDFDEQEKRLRDSGSRVEESHAQVRRVTRRLSLQAEARGAAEARLALVLEELGRVRGELHQEQEVRLVTEAALDALQKNGMPAVHDVSEATPPSAGGLERLSRELEEERSARLDAEREHQAGQVWASGLEAQLRQAQDELQRAWRQAERAQSLEVEIAGFRGRTEQLDRDLAALRKDYEEAVESRGMAEGRAERLVAEAARLSAELEAVQAGTGELEKRLSETERLAAQIPALEQDRLDAHRQLAEAKSRIERLTAELASREQGEGAPDAALAQEETTRERALRQEAEAARTVAVREADMLREELRVERGARIQTDKLLRDRDLLTAEAAKEIERLRAESQRHREAAEALQEERVRAERFEAELESARTALTESRREAESAQELIERLRVLESRAEEWQGTVDRLATEVGSAAQASGTLDSRLGELVRELDRREEALAQERAARNAAEARIQESDDRMRDAEQRLWEASRRIQEAEERLEAAWKNAAKAKEEGAEPLAASAPDMEFSFIPEILKGVSGDDDDDPMIETLLRFIDEPKQEE